MKKGLILIVLIGITIPITASETLVGILMSQDTDSVMIDGRTFEGDGITSLLIAPEFSNSKFGGYLSVGGTFGRSEEEKESDEKNKDFKNTMSYRVANLGIRYSPISNIAFLGGVGYAQSEGKYYHNFKYDKRNRIKFDTSRTEKDRGINYNAGLNFSYKNWGIITMYDTYPKVFSVGISYKNKPRLRPRPRPKQTIQPKKSSGMGALLGIGAAAIIGYGMYKGLKASDNYSSPEKEEMLSKYRERKSRLSDCKARCEGLSRDDKYECNRHCNNAWN